MIINVPVKLSLQLRRKVADTPYNVSPYQSLGESHMKEVMVDCPPHLRNNPRKHLGYLPTPLIRLSNLEQHFDGLRLYMKRDDQTGLGFGGNKTRKLEFLIGDALDQGADCLITAGAAQSNHCRQTAAAAAASGLECHLALGGHRPDKITGNLLLDKLFNAQIHWSGNLRKGENIPKICAQLEKAGKKPYIIPYGGSNVIGALGFVAAMFELESQLEAAAIDIDHIFFASSSGGTHSGMLVGKKLLNRSYALNGINIDKDEVFGMELVEYILKLAGDTAQYIGEDITFTASDIDLNDDYLGAGYGIVGKLEREAINLIAQHEGILLDPVYTGRAMGGLLDMIRQRIFSKDTSILFWHTGGSPALFAYEDKLQ